MFHKLTLENFKNFRQAELKLGQFTVLIGANASGKSNLREAFRFLHGIGRGYTLPEIIDEKWIEGGVRVWNGIRGGARELAFEFENHSEHTFMLRFFYYIETPNDRSVITYAVEVFPGTVNQYPQIISEYLDYNDEECFSAWVDGMGNVLVVSAGPIGPEEFYDVRWDNTRPILFQIQHQLPHFKLGARVDFVELVVKVIESTIASIKSMRFFEFEPIAMRMPSLPGQTVLGDRGENLSSVLYAICQDEEQKQTLTSYLEDLTPMEVVDFEFPTDQIGRVLVTLVEKNGQRISAYSASDGTLRILAMLAAFLGSVTDSFYFFEELENGIHPTRLHLLTQLIEYQSKRRGIQVVASTHSPYLLNFLQAETLEYASLLYRLEGQPDAHIQHIMDIPDARRLIQEQGILRLHESGWFENVMFFLDDDEEAEPEAEAVG